MKRAFTLLEVLVALTIFAIASLAAMQVAALSVHNLQRLQEKMVAGWVADNQAAQLYLMTAQQRARPRAGESEMAGARWYWRTQPVASAGMLLQVVDVDVSDEPSFQPLQATRRAWFAAGVAP